MMKTILSVKKYIAAGIVVSLLVGALCLVFPAGSVAAATPDPNVTPTAESPTSQAANRIQRLENVYQAEQKTLVRQGDILNKLNTLTARAQKVIATLQSRGIDITTLQQALISFQAQIVTGQTYYDNANTVLTTHAGFDNNGVVIDRVQARTTVRTARQDFVSFRQTLLASIKNLRQTIKEFRQANRRNQQSPSTPIVPTATTSQS